MSGRKTIAFKGTESEKSRVDNVADDLDMTRNDFLKSVVMSYVEHYERDLTRQTDLMDIKRRSDDLIDAVRRLDVVEAIEEEEAL